MKRALLAGTALWGPRQARPPVSSNRSHVLLKPCYSYAIDYVPPQHLHLRPSRGITATTSGKGDLNLNHPERSFQAESACSGSFNSFSRGLR
jgi:hypothetical protein